MANERQDERSGPQETEITVVVVPGRVRATLANVLPSARLRTGLALVALIIAVAAGTVIAVAVGTNHAVRPPETHPSPPAAAKAVLARYGIRVNCPRLTLVSPDGKYARIDFDHAGTCGTYEDRVTLVLHRVRRTWVSAFEASTWTCPMTQLPARVAAELQLCGPS